MKKHLLGFCVTFIFFFGGFYVSPIRFFLSSSSAADLTISDGADWCSSSAVLTSNHLTNIYSNSCDYGTEARAIDYFNRRIDEAVETVEPTSVRDNADGSQTAHVVIVLLQNNERRFCLIRANKEWVTVISSTSERHILEFERQMLNGGYFPYSSTANYFSR